MYTEQIKKRNRQYFNKLDSEGKTWKYIEVTGRTIDDALTNACLKLETTSDNIEYEVIEKEATVYSVF